MKKKVYPVLKEYWEDSEVIKVFDSKEKALKYIDEMNEKQKNKRWESQYGYTWYEFDLE